MNMDSNHRTQGVQLWERVHRACDQRKDPLQDPEVLRCLSEQPEFAAEVLAWVQLQEELERRGARGQGAELRASDRSGSPPKGSPSDVTAGSPGAPAGSRVPGSLGPRPSGPGLPRGSARRRVAAAAVWLAVLGGLSWYLGRSKPIADSVTDSASKVADSAGESTHPTTGPPKAGATGGTATSGDPGKAPTSRAPRFQPSPGILSYRIEVHRPEGRTVRALDRVRRSSWTERRVVSRPSPGAHSVVGRSSILVSQPVVSPSTTNPLEVQR